MTTRVITLGLATVLVLAGCGDDEPADADGPVDLVDVLSDVDYYPACSNEALEIDGTDWYPVPEWGNDHLAELHAEITARERQQHVAVQGFAPRVAPPAPGDDVGTMVVWADGVARFESESGLVQWFTAEEQTYDWVC